MSHDYTPEFHPELIGCVMDVSSFPRHSGHQQAAAFREATFGYSFNPHGLHQNGLPDGIEDTDFFVSTSIIHYEQNRNGVDIAPDPYDSDDSESHIPPLEYYGMM